MSDRPIKLRPIGDFDWTAVSWGGPHERVALTCSYCDAVLGEDEMPLMFWNRDGWAAQFCEACQQTYWGLTYPDNEGNGTDETDA